MSGIRHGSHLDHLLELRDRVDAEITKERARMKDADRLRAHAARERARNEAKAAAKAARDAERAEQRATSRAERERQEQARLAEIDAIEKAAPADLVRAWAREHGITVGNRGRLPLQLRRDYLAATATPIEGAATA